MSNQQTILLHLKEYGAQTAQQLAGLLGMTSMGARKHLLKLRSEGLVSDFSSAEKIGRPTQYWQLTSAGHREFPDRHGELTVQLIDAVQQVFGSQGLDQLIHRREHDNLVQYRQAMAGATTLQEKVATLAQLRKAEGYMAVWEPDEADNTVLWLHENHCPICDAAAKCLNFCRSELALFQQVLGSDVEIERINHILTGARRCSYRLRPASGSKIPDKQTS